MHPPLTRELLSETIRTSQMTCWFNLNMLAGTLRDIAVSSLIGDRFDRRTVMASTPQPDYFDYDTPQHRAAPFWFDYTSDVGDGIGLRVAPKRWEVVERFRERAPCVVPAAGELMRPHVIERNVIEHS